MRLEEWTPPSLFGEEIVTLQTSLAHPLLEHFLCRIITHQVRETPFPVSDERNEYNGAARLQRRSPPLARTTPVAGDEWLPPVT
jgi:hypothetical protein